jgi:hypothetical protein
MLSCFRNLTLFIFLFTSPFALAESQAAPTSLPNISVEWVTTQCAMPCEKSTQNTWWMFREGQQVELRNIDVKTKLPSQYSELWQRNPDNKLNYAFIMHDEQRAIDYLFDDLKILAIEANNQKWEVLTQLIPQDEMRQLKKTDRSTEKFQGFATEEYAGEINGAKVNLLWIPELSIPAKLEYSYPQQKVTVNLQKIIDASAQNHTPVSSTKLLDTYQRVYYTDIGDMEQNTEAQVWLAKAHGAPGLHSHHH